MERNQEDTAPLTDADQNRDQLNQSHTSRDGAEKQTLTKPGLDYCQNSSPVFMAGHKKKLAPKTGTHEYCYLIQFCFQG